MAEGVLVVCVRVGLGVRRVAGSTVGRCGDCGAEVWVSPSSPREAGEKPEVACAECIGPRLLRETEQVMSMTRGQVMEPPPYLGREN